MTTSSSPSDRRERQLTGRHVLAIALGAFAVILAANLTMASYAIGSFPGLVAKNSWVASQDFTRRIAAQAELGWDATVEFADGQLLVRLVDAEGAVVPGAAVTVTVGRPTTETQDQVWLLPERADGYGAAMSLEPGVWRIDIHAMRNEGESYTASARLFLRDGV